MKQDKSQIEEIMQALLYYVPTGTTEGERHILNEAFVQTEEYKEIITPPPNSPRLLVGKKGSGKSAIIDFSINMLLQSNVPALLLKPLDIELDNMPPGGSSGELTRIAYKGLLKALAENIGSQLTGYIGGENTVLYQEAIASGTQDLDFVGKLSRLLAAVSKPITSFDFTKLLPNTDHASAAKLERALKTNINESSGAFYLFIDDTDQVASPGTSGHLNRIWAVLLAAREISYRIPKSRVIISLRDEIWRELSKEEVGQRDQWDHFLRLVFVLNPSLDHVQEIIERRLILAAKKWGSEKDKPHYPYFFEGDRPKMPTSSKRSNWPDIIRTRSRERPRDAVQLVNMLAKKAIEPPVSKITDEILAKVMPIYSEERATLLSQEYEKECPSLNQIIRSFAKLEYDEGSFLAGSEQIKKHLSFLPSSFSIKLSGTVVNPDDDEQLFRLWSFLFSIGFIFPRVSDSRQSDNYRFINPSEDPNFVCSGRWNDIQKALWEIHPAFRDHLIAVQKDEQSQFGLPRKTKLKKRR
ncbi:MAG: hypothetical protein KJ915_00155 [Candidatus Omnitrophica bacterium]|nr:hypothetical protein [Candidatus Omnitrophota bacterium]